MNKGKIIQIMGPVVDVAFPDELPAIKEALEVQLDGKRLVMEVSQHIGNNCVRCIMLATSDGLCKDMEVVATGSSISVPVGQKDLGPPVQCGRRYPGRSGGPKRREALGHSPAAPSFEDQSPNVEILETGIKVIDLLTPYQKGGKIGLFGGAA